MNTEQSTGGPTAGESADQLIASVLVAMAGTAMFNLSPLYLAAAAAEHGFTDHQLGFLMSLEVAGIALASLLVLILIDRTGTRRLAAVGGAFIVAGNLLAFAATDFAQLLAIRFLTGLAGDGLAFGSAIVLMGRRADPVRAFGIYAFSNMCFTGIALALLPQLPDGASWSTILGLLVLLGSVAVMASCKLSNIAKQAHCLPTTIRSPLAWLALAGVFFFTMNLGAVWGFAERLGSASGLVIEQVGYYLSLSIACQALGSLLAAYFSRYPYRRFLLIVTVVVQVAGLGLIGNGAGVLPFAVGIALWGLSWNFGIANLLGLLAKQPGGGRLLALAPGAEALGAATGPAVVGLISMFPAVSATCPPD